MTATTIFHFREGVRVARSNDRSACQSHGRSVARDPHNGVDPRAGNNEVLSGDGKFRGKAATVRLSGAVDLSQLASANKIAFDCTFVIDLL
ncbi:hypothetical protein [Methylocystis sp. S23]